MQAIVSEPDRRAQPGRSLPLRQVLRRARLPLARPAQRPVWDVRRRLQENFDRVEAVLQNMEAADEPKLRLAAAEELRQHIALAHRALETAARAEAVAAFQDAVLESLAEASATVRARVLERLAARLAQAESGERSTEQN